MRKKLVMRMDRRDRPIRTMQQPLLDCTRPSRMHRTPVSGKEVFIDRWDILGRSRNGQQKRADKKPHSRRLLG